MNRTFEFSDKKLSTNGLYQGHKTKKIKRAGFLKNPPVNFINSNVRLTWFASAKSEITTSPPLSYRLSLPLPSQYQIRSSLRPSGYSACAIKDCFARSLRILATAASLSYGLSLSLPSQCQIRPSLRPTGYLSSRAATPGSTLPSINSREAPPPVET